MITPTWRLGFAHAPSKAHHSTVPATRGEAVRRGGQSDQRRDDRAHARLVEIDAADDGFADARGCRQLLEHFIGDEALIDATQSIGKLFQHAFQSPHHLGELLQRATAVELARVMSNRLDAKDAFAPRLRGGRLLL